MNEELKELRNGLNDYARLKINLAWLRSLKTTSAIWGNVMSSGLIAILLFVVLVFASFALGFYLEATAGSLAGAFGIVSGIWLFAAIVLLIFKNSLLVRPLMNSFLRIISKNINLSPQQIEDDQE